MLLQWIAKYIGPLACWVWWSFSRLCVLCILFHCLVPFYQLNTFSWFSLATDRGCLATVYKYFKDLSPLHVQTCIYVCLATRDGLYCGVCVRWMCGWVNVWCWALDPFATVYRNKSETICRSLHSNRQYLMPGCLLKLTLNLELPLSCCSTMATLLFHQLLFLL